MILSSRPDLCGLCTLCVSVLQGGNGHLKEFFYLAVYLMKRQPQLVILQYESKYYGRAYSGVIYLTFKDILEANILKVSLLSYQ